MEELGRERAKIYGRDGTSLKMGYDADRRVIDVTCVGVVEHQSNVHKLLVLYWPLCKRMLMGAFAVWSSLQHRGPVTS